MASILLASRSHRESALWEIPTSRDNDVALAAPVPVRRDTILLLIASEYFNLLLPSRPARPAAFFHNLPSPFPQTPIPPGGFRPPERLAPPSFTYGSAPRGSPKRILLRRQLS